MEKTHNEITELVIHCAILVHKEFGAGLLESVYEACLYDELKKTDLLVQKQVPVPLVYKGKTLDKDFFLDLLVEDKVVIEVKAVEVTLPVHEAQLVTYLKLSGKKLGLLINFNTVLLKDGIKRKINGNLNEK